MTSAKAIARPFRILTDFGRGRINAERQDREGEVYGPDPEVLGTAAFELEPVNVRRGGPTAEICELRHIAACAVRHTYVR